MPRSRPLEERFWEKVDTTGDCWLWAATVDHRGYGIIRARNPRRMLRAHRLSYEIHYGPVPEGLEVCHHCDIPACVNPDHLYAGTHQENLREAWDKGRLLLPQVYKAMHEEAA